MIIKRNNKVSIVVVSLNTKLFFLNTVSSIISQTYQNKEIIIVDGNSTDGTKKLIKKMKKNFKKIIIENDNGIYDAMNKGSKLASGDWIIFLNSGDIFYNKKTLSDIFNKYILKNVDIIYGNTLIQNNNINYIVKGSAFTKKTLFMPFCHQSTIVRSNILKTFKFSQKYKYSSDFNFFIKCFYNNKNFYNSNLIISKVVANGFSDKNRQKVYNENIQILKNFNYNYFLILHIFILKLTTLVKSFVKYILPNNLVEIILKLKYKKNINKFI
jgi:glycosyltransferase involved in cell wall biosynthesis